MTYNINKTNGDLLASIPDGTFNTGSSSLTLIGKNVTSFGEILNENFVKLLENFSNPTEPPNAIKGQLWYDTSTSRLNIYDGTSFRTASGPIISNTAPTNLVSGDLWINSSTNQLWFYDGTDLILAGPIYKTQQGLTGFEVTTVLDSNGQDRVICSLYVNNTLLGIFSKYQFDLRTPITGYDGTLVKVGFNASNLAGLKFNVTVSSAERILDDQGVPRSAADIAFLNSENTFGELTILQKELSFAGVAEAKVVDNNLVIEQQVADKNISLKVKTGSTTRDGVTVQGQGRVGIFNNNPQATLDVAGDVIVTGNLTVNGSTTTVTSNDLQVVDKNIVLGASASPSDSTANGGGITLRGTTDKTFTWDDSTDSWTSSENIAIASGKALKINGSNVLTSTTLGPTVVSSSLTSVGTLTSLAVDNISINGNEIVSTNLNGDISLSPNGSGVVNVNSSRVSNLTDPANPQDASTKAYVDRTAFLRGIALSMDITGLTTNAQIAQVLDKIAPFYVPGGNPTQQTGVAVDGTYCRLHCTKISVTNSQVAASTLSYTRVTVDKDNVSSSQSVVADVTANPVAGPTATVVVTRQDKIFIMGGSPSGPGTGVSGQWGFYADDGYAYTTPFTSLGFVLP